MIKVTESYEVVALLHYHASAIVQTIDEKGGISPRKIDVLKRTCDRLVELAAALEKFKVEETPF